MASGLALHHEREGFCHPRFARPLITTPPEANQCIDIHMIDARWQFAVSGIAAGLCEIWHWTAYKSNIDLQPERGSQTPAGRDRKLERGQELFALGNADTTA